MCVCDSSGRLGTPREKLLCLLFIIAATMSDAHAEQLTHLLQLT